MGDAPPPPPPPQPARSPKSPRSPRSPKSPRATSDRKTSLPDSSRSSTSSHARSPRAARPAGPRPDSASPRKRDSAGSTRTLYYEEAPRSPLASGSAASLGQSSSSSTSAAPLMASASAATLRGDSATAETLMGDSVVTVGPPSPSDPHSTAVEGLQHMEQMTASPTALPDSLPAYRSPEAVIDIDDDEAPPSALPPGVLEVEELSKKSVQWADPPLYTPAGASSGRPVLGCGYTWTALVEALHVHPVYRLDQAFTPAQLDGLPGGRSDHASWWYCPTCFGWLRARAGTDDRPAVLDMDAYRVTMSDAEARGLPTEEMRESEAARETRLRKLALIDAARSGAPAGAPAHMHDLSHLVPPSFEGRIPRTGGTEHMDFIHLDANMRVAMGETEDVAFDPPTHAAELPVLSVSCTTADWALANRKLVPGQMTSRATTRFTNMKHDNPNVGQDGKSSVVAAWTLISTLLSNVLFEDKRGWVKLENKRFAREVGSTLVSSRVLEEIGFGCKDEPGEGYRVGPLSVDSSAEDVAQMDRYMFRAWYELQIYLATWVAARGEKPASPVLVSLTDSVAKAEPGDFRLPQEDRFVNAAKHLGVSLRDTAETISAAYAQQCADEPDIAVDALEALETMSTSPIPHKDLLQIQVATERSMGKLTNSDIVQAYDAIGLTPAHLEQIMIDTIDEVPDEYILTLHAQRMRASFDASERHQLSQALDHVGRARGNDLMVRLGRDGQMFLTPEQAFQEFGATEGIDDDMLIMQYELLCADRPARKEHYRMCLEIIAKAENEQGAPRAVLQAYLSGKTVTDADEPPRKDLPVGLRNIGNTCYLNSCLQFLYALKPVREAVMNFREETAPPPKPDALADVQSSRQLVLLLQRLFTEMFRTEQRAVAPEEELARLALVPIGRVAERGEPTPVAKRLTIDDIPTVDSPSSTHVASPSPQLSPLGGPDDAPHAHQEVGSILGKRASEDREVSPAEARPHPAASTPADLIDFGTQDDVDMAGGTVLEPPADGPPAPRSTGQGTGDIDMTGGLLLDTPDRAPPRLAEIETPAADLSHLALSPTHTKPAAPPTPPATPPAAARPVPPPLPPRHPSKAIADAEKFGSQQDAAEILINVLSQLEAALGQPEGGKNLIQRLFSCTFQQQLVLGDRPDPPSETVFSHPIINPEPAGKDLYDCLGELYLVDEEVEYAGGKGKKVDTYDEFPDVLYIQMRLKRQSKTNTHVAFEQTLAMDRFLAKGDKRARSAALVRDMLDMRAQLAELKGDAAKNKQAMAQQLRLARDMLAHLGPDLPGAGADDEDALAALAAQADAADAAVRRLEDAVPERKRELERLWADERAVEYELVSVFMHAGSGSGGHYWTCQANLPKGDKFFYYSDDTVREMAAADVLADSSARGTSPALLCYVRRGRGLVDTLHREGLVVDDLV